MPTRCAKCKSPYWNKPRAGKGREFTIIDKIPVEGGLLEVSRLKEAKGLNYRLVVPVPGQLPVDINELNRILTQKYGKNPSDENISDTIRELLGLKHRGEDQQVELRGRTKTDTGKRQEKNKEIE